MKLVLTILIVCLAFAVQAQYFTVEQLQKVSQKGMTFKYPVVHLKSNNIVAQKINNTLHQSELRRIIGDPEDESVNAFDYEVRMNTAKILGIEFMIEDCSQAYCDEYYIFYNFDSRTGELIELEKLFTEKGFAELKKTLYNTRIRTVKTALKKASSADNADAMSMYNECLETLNEDDIYKGGFFFESGKIYFQRYPCSPYVIRDIDEIGTFEDMFFIKSLKKELSAYGKELTK